MCKVGDIIIIESYKHNGVELKRPVELSQETIEQIADEVVRRIKDERTD